MVRVILRKERRNQMQITEKCKYFRSSATKEDILNHESVCSIPEVEQCPDDAGCPSDKNCKNCFMTGKEK